MIVPSNSNNKRTPEEEARLREMLASGMSTFLVAAKLKRAVQAIKTRALLLGISTKRGSTGLKAKTK